MPLFLLLKTTSRSMSFLLSDIFSLFLLDEISEQGDSFLFCEIRSVSGELSWVEDEILDLDVNDDFNEDDENVEKLLIFTSEFFS